MKGFIKTLRNDPFLLHRMLASLRHVQPKTAEAFQCEVLETR